jgi:hypothetical protein
MSSPIFTKFGTSVTPSEATPPSSVSRTRTCGCDKGPRERGQEHAVSKSVLLGTPVLRGSECGQIVGSPCQFGCRGNQTTHLKLANQYREQAVTHDPSSKVTRYATWHEYDPRDLTSTLTSLKITYLSCSAELHYENQPLLLCNGYATFVLMAELTPVSPSTYGVTVPITPGNAPTTYQCFVSQI